MSQIGFIIDMDGVIYKGNKMIEGASAFIQKLQKMEIPFLFATNNSQRSRRDIQLKLSKMDINVEERNIFTCAMATARFLARQKPGGTAYVIGEGGLLNALFANGYVFDDQNPDYVVVGEGKTFNMNQIEAATKMIMNGSKLIATNLDPNCPVDDGIRPGCGAIVAMLEKATGRQAFSLGKPSPVIMREARQELGTRSANTFMIGDTMETDILGAVQMGYNSVLVLSGGTKESDLDLFAYRPDIILNSVAELIDHPLLQKSLINHQKAEAELTQV